MKNILKDNGGWGIADEFKIIAVLALALIVAIFLISRNFGGADLDEITLTTEEIVLNAASDYVSANYGSIKDGDELIIRDSNLIDDGYLDASEIEGCEWAVHVIGDDYTAYSECG